MKNFQIIILVIFIAAAILGVFVFSGAIPIGSNKDKNNAQGTVILWGTAKNSLLAPALENFNNANPTFVVKYVEKNPETFDQDLLEALAAGVGPDMFFLPDNLAFHYKNKIFVIPYASYPVASFKNVFAGAGEVFLTSKGLLAFPIAIDPMVLYYNRSILDTNSIVYPPTSWDEVQNLVPILTKKSDDKKILKSTIALGQFTNIKNAKDILALLFMQSGNPILREENGVYQSTLAENSNKVGLESALSFFTSFADPLKEVYSWNKSLPNSVDTFTSENLAFYLGYASELPYILNKNPNLNFAIAQVPQVKNSSYKLTMAQVTGIAISSFSKNLNTAITAASLMATGDFASDLINAISVAPAKRALLAEKRTDAYSPIIYASALFGKSWLDPSIADTNNIFRVMLDKVLSNNLVPREAVEDANDKLDLLLIKYK